MEGNEWKMNGNERKMEGNERKTSVFLRVFARHDLKIDVSCEASVDFHHMSENATPATEFAALTMRFAKKNTQHEAADDANLLRLPHKIDVDTLKKHDLEPLRAAVTRRLAS